MRKERLKLASYRLPRLNGNIKLISVIDAVATEQISVVIEHINIYPANAITLLVKNKTPHLYTLSPRGVGRSIWINECRMWRPRGDSSLIAPDTITPRIETLEHHDL